MFDSLKKPVLRLVGAALVAGLSISFSAPGLAADVAGPEVGASDPLAIAYVEKMSADAFVILNQSDIENDSQREAFRGLVKSSFDFQRIGMFALSKHRRTASSDEVAEFLEAFEAYAIGIYETRLGAYSGEQLEVTGSRVRRASAKGSEIIVDSKVIFADNSAPWTIKWRVLHRGDRYRIVDVQVAGIWMALEQRSQFSSIIQREKGSVAALTKILQKQSAATADL